MLTAPSTGLREPLRVLALLEASSISGTAKAVLEMAYEAQADVSGGREIQIHVACFSRDVSPAGNALTRALEAAHIPFSFIREKGRFDTAVMAQIRDLIGKHEAGLIWSNSIKSHFLVHRVLAHQAKLKSCRWLAFHHGYTATDFKMRIYNELDRISLRRAQRVLTVCQPFAAQMKARGVKESRIRIQHMPVRPFPASAEDAAVLRAELGIAPGEKVILSVGRLSQEKGQVDLITAFADLREAMKDARLRLVLVGDGPERGRLERQAQRRGAGDCILFAGHRDDAKRFYGMSDVFALPSYTEGTPNVLLEAMCASVPVVATRVGGIPELAVDGRNALLVPAANPAALAKALRKLFQSADLRNELAGAAASVVAAHSPRHYFEGMSKIFFEVEAG